jgi:hypothetical protein
LEAAIIFAENIFVICCKLIFPQEIVMLDLLIIVVI